MSTEEAPMTAQSSYRERLTPSIGVYLATALVIPAAYLVFLPINATAGIIVAAVFYLGAVTVLLVTSPRITVTPDGLRAGPAHLPPDVIGAVTCYRNGAATQQRGPVLDARAWTLFRGWIDPVVRIDVLDDTDPAPYWLISTRRPDQLAAALEMAATHSSRERPVPS
jgi:hypothetical protein